MLLHSYSQLQRWYFVIRYMEKYCKYQWNRLLEKWNLNRASQNKIYNIIKSKSTPPLSSIFQCYIMIIQYLSLYRIFIQSLQMLIKLMHVYDLKAMSMGLGGNPYGPAGTGKTESVKALGGLLGRQVLVFNCDEVICYLLRLLLYNSM